MQITPNFSRAEFACKCGCGLADIDPCLVHRLQVIRDIARQPIRIISGCRCVNHNKAVEGAPGSLHMDGRAADWTVDTDLDKLADILAAWKGGFHHYAASHFIHTDIGSYRRWT